MKVPDEPTLLKRLKEGDTAAYFHFYDQYHHALYIYILRFVKIPAVAEDILQDVFLKIWEIREHINPELCFNAYVYRITRNKVFKWLKRMARDEETRSWLMHQLQKDIETPHLQLQWKHYNSILLKAIHQLPPQRQRVFKLCREQGKTYDEAASELGISPNTIKEHMISAMKSIKDYVRRHGDIFLLAVIYTLTIFRLK